MSIPGSAVMHIPQFFLVVHHQENLEGDDVLPELWGKLHRALEQHVQSSLMLSAFRQIDHSQAFTLTSRVCRGFLYMQGVRYSQPVRAALQVRVQMLMRRIACLRTAMRECCGDDVKLSTRWLFPMRAKWMELYTSQWNEGFIGDSTSPLNSLITRLKRHDMHLGLGSWDEDALKDYFPEADDFLL